jgi:hypothetical protein
MSAKNALHIAVLAGDGIGPEVMDPALEVLLFEFSFRLAERRKARGKLGALTCVDKANVFKAFAFFREMFDEAARPPSPRPCWRRCRQERGVKTAFSPNVVPAMRGPIRRGLAFWSGS